MADEDEGPDARDRRLLARLTADARTPVAALAREVHLSESAVRRRIARLEARGSILGYTLVRPARVPADAPVRAVLEVHLDGARCRELAEALDDCPHVAELLSLAGEVDTLAMLEAPDVAAIGRVADRVAALGFVRRVTTRMVLDVPLHR